jgi:hypothetical protein
MTGATYCGDCNQLVDDDGRCGCDGPRIPLLPEPFHAEPQTCLTRLEAASALLSTAEGLSGLELELLGDVYIPEDPVVWPVVDAVRTRPGMFGLLRQLYRERVLELRWRIV